MLYTNLHKEILKVYNEDVAETVNATAQTISDTRQANAQQASQFSNVSELLSSKETFMAQCSDIFKSNSNFDVIATDLRAYLKYDTSRDFITAIAGGLNPQELTKQLGKISNDYLNNPALLAKILTMVTDDIVKMPEANKNKWTMAAQHLKDSLSKAINTTGPKNAQPTAPAQTTPKTTGTPPTETGDTKIIDGAEAE